MGDEGIKGPNQQHMSKSQDRNIWNKRRQGNMTPQKVNNLNIEDLVDSEGDEYRGQKNDDKNF
jgi:hypothetical protein